MPTYDYECDACGHAWELFQNITADPITKCPSCNRKKARRLFGTGAALMFKGSGFYETDYRSESYKKSAKADQAPAEGSSSSTEGSSSSTEGGSNKSDSMAKSDKSTQSEASAPKPERKTESGKNKARRKPKAE